MKEQTFSEALRDALSEEMLRDERVYIIGEDIAFYKGGGLYGVTRGLVDRFGKERVIDTPICEQAIVGSCVGAAIMGMRPVADLMDSEFLVACFCEVVYEAAQMRFVTDGDVRVPLVIRTASGAEKAGFPYHSKSPEAWFIHAPGLKVIVPSTPADAKGLLKAAIRDDDPVLFLEHKRLYQMKGEVPEEEYIIPIGKAEIKRHGNDVTIVAVGWMVHEALAAAEDLVREGIDLEVVDPRTLLPLDKATILNSVRKTGKVVIVEESLKTGGIGAEMSAIIAEQAFDHLRAPVMRVASPDIPVVFPLDKEDIIKAVREIVTT